MPTWPLPKRHDPPDLWTVPSIVPSSWQIEGHKSLPANTRAPSPWVYTRCFSAGRDAPPYSPARAFQLSVQRRSWLPGRAERDRHHGVPATAGNPACHGAARHAGTGLGSGDLAQPRTDRRALLLLVDLGCAGAAGFDRAELRDRRGNNVSRRVSQRSILGGFSVFNLMIMVQQFYGSGSYSIIGPYMAEIWPSRLRASGMGLAMAPAILANSSVRPGLLKGNRGRTDPGDELLRGLVCPRACGGPVIGFETRGRTIDEIDSVLTAEPLRPVQ